MLSWAKCRWQVDSGASAQCSQLNEWEMTVTGHMCSCESDPWPQHLQQ